MRLKLLLAITCGLLLAFSAPALAAGNPTTSAYSGVPDGPTSDGTLPFTGVNVGALSAIAFVLLGTGIVLRWRIKPHAD